MERCTRVLVAGAVWLAAWSGGAHHDAFAQTVAPVENVELEPIRCYWRGSATAIRVGEPFTLVLTCSVLESAATIVVPDQSRLDAAVLQLPPFEVVSGTQAPDARMGTRRFFQYAYVVRYIGEDFGNELIVPALTLSYRVQSRVQTTALESRERQYVLPARTVRIASLVPSAAPDIRPVAPPTFADIDARRFRSRALGILASALYALAGFVGIWGLVLAARQRRPAPTQRTPHLRDSAILAGVARELMEVRRERDVPGWNDRLATRALAATRIPSAYLVSWPVVQSPAPAGAPAASGQLLIAAGWPRRQAMFVSAAATAVMLTHAAKGATLPGRHANHAETLRDALDQFAAAAYGRPDAHAHAADATLDEALIRVTDVVNALRRDRASIGAIVRSWFQRRAG